MTWNHLNLPTYDIHLVLIETLGRAKLQLILTIMKVNIVDCVSDMLAPVTDFVFLERCSSALSKAEF